MSTLYEEALQTPPSRRSKAHLLAIIEHLENERDQHKRDEQPVPFSTKIRPSVRTEVGNYARANNMKIQEVVENALLTFIRAE